MDVAALTEFDRRDGALAGGKAANLGELLRAGFDVPPGFVVTTHAYLGAGSDRSELPSSLRAEIAAAYARLGSPPVAVRSSATAEDLPEASFAGQLDTYLNVQGLDAVLAAVRSCWASLWTDRAIAYRQHQGVDPAGLSMAVLVQQMVPADRAGVLFTANPLNGRTDEMVISAARGLGEAVVGGTTQTEETVVDLAAGRVSRSGPDRGDVVVDDQTAYALAALGARIAAHLGAPQDIEWAAVGNRLHILQSRPITALAPAEAAPPTDWTVPDPHRLYVRGSIVEQLPDPLSALFADLIDGAVTRSLTALITELAGERAVRPGDVSLPTINGYAYYAYTWSGMLRITVRSVRALPMLGSGRRSGRERWRTYSRPRYQQVVAAWAGRAAATLSAVDLLAGVVELLDAGAEYYTSVQTIIPVAATSELLFTRFYTALVKRPNDPPPVTFLLGFDSLPIRAEKSLYDLAVWLRGWPALAAEVGATRSAAEISSPFRERLQEHLDTYGHTVYNLDMVNPVPADDPGPLLDTVRFYLSGDAPDPYERQQRSAAAREAATATVAARLDPIRRRIFIRLVGWAQDAAPIREDALADVGLAWPHLRRLVAETGRRLVELGVVDVVEDVYWLRWAELVAALTRGDATAQQDRVAQRRRLWRGRRRVTPPQVLPERRWVKLIARMLPALAQDATGDVITGLAGSSGRVTAVARVLSGPADFGQFQPGEVLVAAITTPAWTSLFVRAAAVVTDVGGPLSHSSIVAREYGIPAVLGTGVATKRIRTGQRVTVDGVAGTVTLLTDPNEISGGSKVPPDKVAR